MARRYVIFSVRFAPFVGGVESFTRNIAKALVDRGDEVAIVTKRIDQSPEWERCDDGVEIVRLPTISLVNDRLPLSRRNKRHRELIDKLVDRGADRVLVNNRFYPHTIDGLRFARRIGVRPVVLDHGSAYLVLGKSALIDYVIKCYEHFMTWRTKQFAPIYAGVSRKSAQWLSTFGIDTDLVISNAIDASDFRANSTNRDFRSELEVDEGSVLVVFVGRLTPEKGCASLMRAAKKFEGADVVFALAGDGFMRADLERAAGDNVRFLGVVNRGDLSALMQQADVFCLPSRSEGFCTSLLESAACGTPAVITDVGGVDEVIPNSSCGIIVKSMSESDVATGLESALELGFEGRSVMGALVQAHVERACSWEASVEALDRTFETKEQGFG